MPAYFILKTVPPPPYTNPAQPHAESRVKQVMCNYVVSIYTTFIFFVFTFFSFVIYVVCV